MSRPAAAQEAARPLSDVGRQALLEPSYWGPFRITPKQSHMCPPHGGFQTQCRWRAKSFKTGCKKLVGIRAATPEAKLHCLNAIRHSCNSAAYVERQRHHVG